MSAVQRKGRQGSPKKVVTKKVEAPSAILLSRVLKPNPEDKVKLNLIDGANGRKFRWTVARGAQAQKAGKFVRVGVAPKPPTTLARQAGATEQAKLLYTAPGAHAKTLDKYLTPETDGKENKDYNPDLVLVTAIDLRKLANAFPQDYKNDLADETDSVLPVYILGTLDDIVNQLQIQKVFKKGNEEQNSALREFIWNIAVGEGYTDENGEVQRPGGGTYLKWKETEEYKDLANIKTEGQAKKLDSVNQEDALAVMYLKKAKNTPGALRVFDVNGVEIATFGQPATKSATNDLADTLVRASNEYTPEEFQTKAFDISGMKDLRHSKVSVVADRRYGKDGKLKETQTVSSSLKVEVPLNGFFFVFEDGTTFDLSRKIYSDNKEAVEYMLEEVKAVTKTGRQKKYGYKGPASQETVVREYGGRYSSIYANLNKSKAGKKPALNVNLDDMDVQ